jgi:hypothetical protein
MRERPRGLPSPIESLHRPAKGASRRGIRPSSRGILKGMPDISAQNGVRTPGLARSLPCRLLLHFVSSLAFALTIAFPWHATAQEKKPAPDVIVFTNGDQLSGAVERGSGSNITFKSDMAGEITVSLDKVKELRSAGSFAVLRKDIPPSRKTVTPGTLIFQDGKLTVASPTGPPEIIPTPQIGYIIDQTTYDMELEKKPGPLYGWNGTINGGATIVRSTDNGSTYTAGIALKRAIPAVPYLPARNRTAFNLQETYGKLTQPVVPQPLPPAAAVPASVAVTSIFHSDAERDEYFSAKFYGLAQTSFDHNYAQGLDLQQVYGVGVGWTPLKSAAQQLDVKVDLHYEKQTFQIPAGNVDLIGSTFSETYTRNLPRKLVLNQALGLLPAWNQLDAYSANGSVAISMPLIKRLSLTVTTTDSFLNDPSPGYKKNSFQFVTAASYTLH